MIAMIPCGGLGTRLRPITATMPKALLPYRGQAVVESICEQLPPDMPKLLTVNAASLKAFKTWLNATVWDRHFGALCSSTLPETPSFAPSVEFCVERSRKGALSSISYWIKQKRVQEDLLVVAGDNYVTGLDGFISECDGHSIVLGVYDVGTPEKARGFGVVQVASSRQHTYLVHLAEKPLAPQSSLISTGIYYIPEPFFADLHSFCKERRDNIGDFFAAFASRFNIRIHKFSGEWIDIGALGAQNWVKGDDGSIRERIDQDDNAVTA